MLVKHLKEHLERNFNDDDHVCYHLWQVDDVMARCYECAIPMTREIATEIIDTMDRRVDSEYGVTWNTVDMYVDEVEKPTFYKLYWRSEEGDILSYEVDQERTLFFMIDRNVTESQAWDIGFRILYWCGYTDDLKKAEEEFGGDPDDREGPFFWTIMELEDEDEFWDLNKDYPYSENKMYEFLINPVVLAVNALGLPNYVVPRCPHCGKVLNKIDEVSTESTRWIWEHKQNALCCSEHCGDITTERYECPECLEDIESYVDLFEVNFG